MKNLYLSPLFLRFFYDLMFMLQSLFLAALLFFCRMLVTARDNSMR